MLCVECGTEVPKTIKGSCPACFVAKTPLLSIPEVLDVELCAHCNARRVGKHWQDVQDEALDAWIREDAVREAVGVHHRVMEPYIQFDETPQDEKHFQFSLHMEGEVEGVEIEDTGSVLVRQKRGVCDRCSRMAGNYYAAILQLRATERETTTEELDLAHRLVAEDLDRQQSSGNRFAFLTKGGPMHGGWDYYIGDIEAGRQVARTLKQRLGASVQETAKLVGRREGEDVYRVTFLVRIRLFAPGDFALHNGNIPVQVMQVSPGGHVHCVDLIRHRKTRVAESSLKRLGGSELVQDAVLVSAGEKDLQVMDPQSYRTQDVLRPPEWEPDGETVPVLRHEERLYVVRVANNS